MDNLTVHIFALLCNHLLRPCFLLILMIHIPCNLLLRVYSDPHTCAVSVC